MKSASIAAVKAKYRGMSLNAFFRGSFRSRTAYLMVPKMTADMAPDIKGAIPHEAATWDTLPDCHAHLMGD